MKSYPTSEVRGRSPDAAVHAGDFTEGEEQLAKNRSLENTCIYWQAQEEPSSSSPGRRGGNVGALCSYYTGGDTEARGREATRRVPAKSEGRFA